MIRLKNISKSYDSLHLLKNFNLEFHNNEVTCLLGPSGCGKSTILKILSTLDTHYEGIVEGIKNKNISFVFQEERLLPWLTVKDNLLYVLDGKLPAEQISDHVMHFIKKVGLEGFEDSYPSALSGGMKQRVSLARAFATPHDILLLDEPFQGIDDALKEQLMTLLEDLLSSEQKIVIMVTHDISEARRLASRIIHLGNQPVEILLDKRK